MLYAEASQTLLQRMALSVASYGAFKARWYTLTDSYQTLVRKSKRASGVCTCSRENIEIVLIEFTDSTA